MVGDKRSVQFPSSMTGGVLANPGCTGCKSLTKHISSNIPPKHLKAMIVTPRLLDSEVQP